MLKAFVKVGEVNNLSDARYCAGMGVQLIGFLLSSTQRKSLTKEEYIAITQWLEGPQFVGEFENSSDDFIIELNKVLTFDYVQTNDAAQAHRLIALGLKTILLLAEAPANVPSDISYIVIEESFTGEASDLDEEKVLWGKEVSTAALNDLIESTGYYGLHLKGSDELRPGYKNFDELADILEALED